MDAEPRSSRKRKWLLRCGAMVVGFAPLLLAELVFGLMGWGSPNDIADPFVGFASTRPLFQLDETNEIYSIAENRLDFFRPDSFLAKKPDDQFRIFCLGGSTVQGRPFAIETSFTTWLELGLNACDTQSREWQVVNCGGISYASYRLVPILEEVLQYQPDLIIVYTGHNEFLEHRTYEHLKAIPDGVRNTLSIASRLRTPHVLREVLSLKKTAPPTRTLAPEVDAMLDYAGALEKYHHDPVWHRNIVDHFRFNLARMIQLCDAADVPIWLVNPVCDLSGTPPFKSEHAPGLTAQEKQKWETLRQQARSLFRSNVSKAITLLHRAAAIDDQCAILHYDLGKCYESRRQFDQARVAYIAAKETDVCPLRITEPLRKAILKASKSTGTSLIDVHQLFEEQRNNRIAGGHLLADHVHPSIQGHQLIAEQMMKRLQQGGVAQLRGDYQAASKATFRDHLGTLDIDYYLAGEQNLANLMLWARGRAERVRASAEP